MMGWRAFEFELNYRNIAGGILKVAMITQINSETISSIKNQALRDYAQVYVQIYADFMAQISQLGLAIEEQSDGWKSSEKIQQLRAMGATLRNDSKSVVINHLSPSCEACRTGKDSATFFISLRCHRNCYYCFNPNQEDYEYHLDHKRDVVAELDEYVAHRVKLKHIALTGGEPLLQPDEVIRFFEKANILFPKAYTRLYTSGDHLNESILQALQAAGLTEIRLSIRMHDSENALAHTFDRLELAKCFIPHVMVEMPVLPGTFKEMKAVLLKLEEIGIYSINLLEFCFPLTQPEEFHRRGFKIKARPFRVLYDYWYAGGLPIAGSEQVCLDLVEYAIQENLHIGVHYCSLENKHSGQIYQQNVNQKTARSAVISSKDFFIKTAKVFGEDIPKVKSLLNKTHGASYEQDNEHSYLAFHPRYISSLKSLDVEIGISSSVIETRPDGVYFRELSIGFTTPQSFEYSSDI